METRILDRRIVLSALLALGLTTTAAAGSPTLTNFNVTNNGASNWVIDGLNNPSLTLVRGQNYQFVLQNVPSMHPFYINVVNTTGAANQYSNGVANNGATGNSTVQFFVSTSAPDSLFYNCGNHGTMNGTLTIVNDAIYASGFDQPPLP